LRILGPAPARPRQTSPIKAPQALGVRATKRSAVAAFRMLPAVMGCGRGLDLISLQQPPRPPATGAFSQPPPPHPHQPPAKAPQALECARRTGAEPPLVVKT